MQSKSAIPINRGDRIFTTAEVQEPTAGVIAKTGDAMKSHGDPFMAMQNWINGTVTGFIDGDGQPTSDEKQVQAIIRQMPYKAAEALIVDSLLAAHEDDAVEGIYACPRCGTKLVCEENQETGIDTRDRVGALERKYSDDADPVKRFDLSKEIEIGTGPNGLMVSTLDIGLVTLTDLATGRQKHGKKQDANFEAIAQAIRKYNGQDVDSKWRNTYGLAIVRKIKIADMVKIKNWQEEFGIQTRVQKTCRDVECGKTWNPEVSPLDFFGSVLRRMG